MKETEDASHGFAMDEWCDVGSTKLLLVLVCGGGDDVRPGGSSIGEPDARRFLLRRRRSPKTNGLDGREAVAWGKDWLRLEWSLPSILHRPISP